MSPSSSNRYPHSVKLPSFPFFALGSIGSAAPRVHAARPGGRRLSAETMAVSTGDFLVSTDNGVCRGRRRPLNRWPTGPRFSSADRRPNR